MADLSRNLMFSVVAEDRQFDLEPAARDLDRLGDAAQDAGRDLDKLDQDVRDVDLEQLGDDAKQTARKVDDAFDDIGRSAGRSADKVDTETDGIRRNLSDVRDEAGSTAREAAASFSGSGDIGDAFQELAANAPAVLGGVGLAAGAAAAAGVGLIRAEAEKLEELVGEMVDEMIESGGRLSDAFIDSKLQDLSKDGTLAELEELAKNAGLAYNDLARSKAGDAEATKRGVAAAEEAVQVYYDLEAAGEALTAEEEIRKRAIRDVLQEYRGSTKAIELAERATKNYQDAAIASAGSVKESSTTARDAWDDLRANLGKPIRAKVDVNAPTPAQLARIRQDMTAGIGTIVVPVKAGTNPFSNTADNSRYRW